MKDSMDQVVYACSQELKARMNALQSQMNPHFLYNVLTIIGTAGQQAGVDKPLIENCFNRAFQLTAPPWIIHILIKQPDEYNWLLEVKDWGSGFSPKALDHLRWRIASEDSFDMELLDEQEQTAGTQGGIGIYNTLARLKLAFGEHFFFEILNNEPTGTNIRMGRKRI